MKTTSKRGDVVGILSVKEDSAFMIVSQNGKMIRIESSTIRRAGRPTHDVRLVSPEPDRKIAAARVIPESEVAQDASWTCCRAAFRAMVAKPWSLGLLERVGTERRNVWVSPAHLDERRSSVPPA